MPNQLVPNASVENVSMCALVLEDNPVGEDSRLVFESFPTEEGIEETYSVAQYAEMGQERMPQPGFVAYRGGNWGPLQIKLVFRAGIFAPPVPADQLTSADIEQQLIEMERKVRWCQALTFPLERTLGAAGQRILQRASTSGVRPTAAATAAVAKMRRNDPPIVLVVFGAWHTIRGYVTQVSIRWMGPWHPLTARPYGAEVSITIMPLMAEYPTWQTIRGGAGVGGFTTTTPLRTPSLLLRDQKDRASILRDTDARRAQANAADRALLGRNSALATRPTRVVRPALPGI
jgi:hypothetical protein